MFRISSILSTLAYEMLTDNNISICLDNNAVILYYYSNMPSKWNSNKIKSLYDAFLKLQTREEAELFIRDLMTESEIDELAGRWTVAQELDKGKSQRVVAKETGVSLATVTRVNKWLTQGSGGYRFMLDKVNKKGKKQMKKDKNIVERSVRYSRPNHHHPR